MVLVMFIYIPLDGLSFNGPETGNQALSEVQWVLRMRQMQILSVCISNEMLVWGCDCGAVRPLRCPHIVNLIAAPSFPMRSQNVPQAPLVVMEMLWSELHSFLTPKYNQSHLTWWLSAELRYLPAVVVVNRGLTFNTMSRNTYKT